MKKLILVGLFGVFVVIGGLYLPAGSQPIPSGFDPMAVHVNDTLTGDVTATFESDGSTATTVTDLTITSEAQGDVLYFNGTNWVRLAKGSAGQVLEMNAGATAPEWDTDDSGGSTAWDDIGDPDGAGIIDFGAHISQMDVNDIRIGATDAGNYMKIAGSAVTFVGTGDIDLPDDSVDTADIGTNQVGLDALNVSDVSDDIAADIAEGELANDVILEEDLKAVNAAEDEDILTRETTTGDFEWHTGGELGIGTATSITDDLIVADDFAHSQDWGEITTDADGVVTIEDSISVSGWILSNPYVSGFIYSNTDMTFRVDADNNGSNEYSFTNGGGTEVAYLNEAGNFQIDGSFIVGAVTWDNGSSQIDGEQIADGTIDDDSIDFTDVTGADLTLTDATTITASGLITGNANLVVKNGATSDGAIDIYEDSDTGGNYTRIQGSDVSANLEWVLPTTNGTAGQVLEIASVASNTLTLEWDSDDGAAGGDSIQIDSVDVVDPDFQSGGDIDFVDTSNVVTANLNSTVVDFAHLNNNAITGATEDSGFTSGDFLLYSDTADSGNLKKVDYDDLPSGSATAWDDIGDADAAASVSFATHTQTIDIAKSDSGGGDGLILKATGLGAGANDVTVLQITTTADDDGDYIPLEVRDDSAGNDDLLFKIKHDGNIEFQFGQTILGTINNEIRFFENSDSIYFKHGGTDLDIEWSDGALNLRNQEDGVDAIVEIEGKDDGEKGILRVLSDGDDKYIEAYHDDTDGYLSTNSGDLQITAAGGDISFGDDNLTTTGTAEAATITEGGVGVPNLNETDWVTNDEFAHSTDWGDIETDGSGNVLIDADNNVTITGDWNFGGATNFEVPNAAAPTAPNLDGEIALDTDLLSGTTGQGILELYSGVQLTYIVATTDTPGDNEVPTYDSTAGTIQWETAAGGGDMSKSTYDVLEDDYVDANDTAYADTWNGTINAPSMNVIYDYLVSFDADADSSYADETWYTNLTDGTVAFTDLNGNDILDSDNYNGGSIDPEHVASGAWDFGTSVEADTITEGGNAVWNSTETDIIDSDHYVDNSIDPAHVASGAWDFGTSLEADTLTENSNAVPNETEVPGMTSTTPKIIFAFNVHDIDDGFDDIALPFPRAMTITKVTAMCIGGTNVVGRLYEVDGDGDDVDAVGIETTDWTFTTTETEDTSFNNATLDAGDYLQWDTTSVSGSVTNFRIAVEGYET